MAYIIAAVSPTIAGSIPAIKVKLEVVRGCPGWPGTKGPDLRIPSIDPRTFTGSKAELSDTSCC